MQFRTEVEITPSVEKIHLEDQIFSIGSCFATEISDLLKNGQLQTLNNPFGTIFNPFSISNAIKKISKNTLYTEENLVEYSEEFISLEHHSQFDSNDMGRTLTTINQSIKLANAFLKGSRWIIITYGTAFIYEFLPQNKLVANCHKIPQKFFSKRLLTTQEIITSTKEIISEIRAICPENTQILFTISPVRHTKDGISENQRSKARLIDALHESLLGEENCHYLPIYELMLDDLRDYRFYKEDMIHPNNQAINYIFKKFGKAYFSDDTMNFINENFKILQALSHRPADDNSPKHLTFKEKLNTKIAKQQRKVTHKIFQQ